MDGPRGVNHRSAARPDSSQFLKELNDTGTANLLLTVLNIYPRGIRKHLSTLYHCWVGGIGSLHLRQRPLLHCRMFSQKEISVEAISLNDWNAIFKRPPDFDFRLICATVMSS